MERPRRGERADPGPRVSPPSPAPRGEPATSGGRYSRGYAMWVRGAGRAATHEPQPSAEDAQTGGLLQRSLQRARVRAGQEPRSSDPRNASPRAAGCWLRLPCVEDSRSADPRGLSPPVDDGRSRRHEPTATRSSPAAHTRWRIDRCPPRMHSQQQSTARCPNDHGGRLCCDDHPTDAAQRQDRSIAALQDDGDASSARAAPPPSPRCFAPSPRRRRSAAASDALLRPQRAEMR